MKIRRNPWQSVFYNNPKNSSVVLALFVSITAITVMWMATYFFFYFLFCFDIFFSFNDVHSRNLLINFSKMKSYMRQGQHVYLFFTCKEFQLMMVSFLTELKPTFFARTKGWKRSLSFLLVMKDCNWFIIFNTFIYFSKRKKRLLI